MTAIGESTATLQGIALYPNPARDHMALMVDGTLTGKHAVIQIFNASGTSVQVVRVNTLGAVQWIDLLPSLAEGMYQVMVNVEGQAPRGTRVIVER